MTHLGLTSDYVKTEKIGGVALEAHIHYLAEVHIDDQVSVYSRLLKRSDKRMHMLHILHNETRDQIAALFEGVMACFDLKARRMCEVPAGIATKIDTVIQEHDALDWKAPLCGVMAP